MTLGTVKTSSLEASLQLNIVALKSLLSEYTARTLQAEQMCNTLLNEKIPVELLITSVTSLLTTHSENRAVERAVHQQAVLQSVLMALNQLSTINSLLEVKDIVNSIVQSMTLSLSSMNPSK